MPVTSSEIFRQLNLEKRLVGDRFGRMIPPGHQINDPKPLFRKLEDDEIKGYKERFAGAQPKKMAKKTAEMEVLVTEKTPEMVPEIEKKVAEQGNCVRQMKAEGKEKADVNAAVAGRRFLIFVFWAQFRP